MSTSASDPLPKTAGEWHLQHVAFPDRISFDAHSGRDYRLRIHAVLCPGHSWSGSDCSRRIPIWNLLKDSTTNPALRQKLELVLNSGSSRKPI